MRDLAVFDMAARLHHLKPANLAQRARGAADAVLNRVLDAFLRGTGDLNDAVNVIGHRLSPCGKMRQHAPVRLTSKCRRGKSTLHSSTGWNTAYIGANRYTLPPDEKPLADDALHPMAIAARPRPGEHHVDRSAAAAGADEPLVPIEDARRIAVAFGLSR